LNNIEKIDSIELIQQAKEAGLLDSNVTIKCVHCHAVFPKEYDICPQCNTNGTYYAY
jgi:rRNA maturation endonuclease Nob1